MLGVSLSAFLELEQSCNHRGFEFAQGLVQLGFEQHQKQRLHKFMVKGPGIAHKLS